MNFLDYEGWQDCSLTQPGACVSLIFTPDVLYNVANLFASLGCHEVVKFLLEHCGVPADPKDR